MNRIFKATVLSQALLLALVASKAEVVDLYA